MQQAGQVRHADADTAVQGYYRDTKHEVKREAEAAKGWFQGKKEEAKPQEDPSQNLGAAYRDAKEQVKSGAGYVRDRCAEPASHIRISIPRQCWPGCQLCELRLMCLPCSGGQPMKCCLCAAAQQRFGLHLYWPACCTCLHTRQGPQRSRCTLDCTEL